MKSAYRSGPDIERLRARLVREYRARTGKSRALFARAEKVMVGGGSHTIRLWPPYPFFAVRAEGAVVCDADGNAYIDYWQGHYANILGHNPPLVRRGLSSRLGRGALHTGFEAPDQIELAELVLDRVGGPGQMIRFTTSGTLADMYAVMLSRAHTGRDLVLKAGGGWHGASPYLLKGIRYRPGSGFTGDEAAGVLRDVLRRTLVTRFNDGSDLERILKARGDRIACFIVEPFLGVGGFLPADYEYLRLARDLTARHGVVLIFDEVISGFRFAPSGVQSFYGIRPDLSVVGKIIGGGHAVAAVLGRREIMEKCRTGEGAAGPVRFEGGTFSSHPEYMRAGLIMLRHLARREASVYPRLARSGDRLRAGIERVFAAEGVPAVCTGGGSDRLPGSSLFMVHFPVGGQSLKTAEDLQDGRRSELRLREEILKLALLVNGVNVVHGGGAVSTEHGEPEIRRTLDAYAAAAGLIRKYLY